MKYRSEVRIRRLRIAQARERPARRGEKGQVSGAVTVKWLQSY